MHCQAYEIARKAKRKAMADNNKASDAHVDLVQAFLARRQRESNAGRALHTNHEQQAPLPPMIHRNNVNESEGTARRQQIAMILAAALQQRQQQQQEVTGSSHTATMTGNPIPGRLDTINRGINDLSSRGGTLQAHQASASSNFPLPMKLYSVLSIRKIEHIISWKPHGRAFMIHDLDLFCEEVLPFFMDGTSSRHFHGFVELLNLWGFRQFFSPGPDTAAFFHQAFLRGHPSLLQTMGPLPLANRVPLHDPSCEPNLYALPPLLDEKKPSDDQQFNPSMLPPDLLKCVVENRLPADQGLRDLHPALFEQQQTAPIYSRANLFQTNTPASTPISGNLSSMQALLEMEGLLAAKEVHDASLLNFDRSNNSNHMQMWLPGLLQQSAVAPVATTAIPAATVTTTTNSEPPNGPKTGGKKAQKPRRKWLPPLGPSTPASRAMTMVHLNKNARKRWRTTKQSAATTTTSDNPCEWPYTSPEAFTEERRDYYDDRQLG